MKIKRIIAKMLSSNTYVIINNGIGVIIDPGAEVDEIMAVVNEENIRIEYIILTHVHIDHILNLDELKNRLKCKVGVHKLEEFYLGNSWQNGAKLFGMEKIFESADLILEDGTSLEFGNETFDIIHTPGHTPGSICIKVGNYLFTGDTLFRRSIGATHLGNGNSSDLESSLIKLMKLSDDIVILPGHGTSSTIGYERENNPYI